MHWKINSRAWRWEEEEEILDCKEEEEEMINEKLMLCLVGKLFTSNPYSVEAMKNTMKIVWRLGKGMVVREIDCNIGAPLLLKPIEEGVQAVQPSEITFGTIRFWVKAKDVSLNKRTKSMEKSMAASMGEFMGFDESDPIGWSKYMHFRVDLKLNKPLKRWTHIATPGGRKPVKFTYEKLMDICHACGCCPKYDERLPISELSYGNWLRASPMKGKSFADHKKKEEYRACHEFKGNLWDVKARAKLSVDNVFNDQGLNL
ncbi:1-deoxy-D-xylulose-5-phosphate synthase [Bienertia sinuspersici]